jgi:preprotein translocase subunit SecD
MLQLETWKRVLILALCAIGLFLAIPNAFYSRVERHNDAVAALAAGQAETPELAADRAAWPSWLPSNIVNLGLDLRGGAQLLAEVETEGVHSDRLDQLWPELRNALRAERDDVGGIRRVDAPAGELRIRIENPQGMDRAVAVARDLARPIVSLTGGGASDLDISSSGADLIVKLSDAEKRATDDRTLRQSLEIIRRRVDEVGTREPTITRQGDDRILIQVPGLGSADELKALIGTTAKLTFHPVVRRTTDGQTAPEPQNLLLPSMDEPGTFYVIDSAPVVTGEELTDAQPSFDQNGRPAVSFRFNPSGARKFGDYTAQHIGSPFAIVLDEQVISAPVIQSHIAGGSGIITGNFNVEQSNQLAVLLRAGALPAEMNFLEERTIGPELGQDSIDAGTIAAVIGAVLVSGFMLGAYGWFGVIANVALAINIAMIFGILSVIGATLTLPGIAGIVLTMGMAVDANVLIFERIKEELKSAKGPARAIGLGYERALSAIIDGNLTTLITAAILYFVGSGPVKGFAITLAIGIVTSAFTAIYVTRLIIVYWFERRRPRTIKV